MPASKNRTQAEVEQRRDAATKHGGASARRAISTNADFTGPAREAELAVTAELQSTDGRLSVVTRAVSRLQATADLYWAAMVEAGENGDTQKLTSYSKTFGWIQTKALSALEQLRKEQESHSDDLILDAINSAKDE